MVSCHKNIDRASQTKNYHHNNHEKKYNAMETLTLAPTPFVLDDLWDYDKDDYASILKQ
jgi:hypothetical protein